MKINRSIIIRLIVLATIVVFGCKSNSPSLTNDFNNDREVSWDSGYNFIFFHKYSPDRKFHLITSVGATDDIFSQITLGNQNIDSMYFERHNCSYTKKILFDSATYDFLNNRYSFNGDASIIGYHDSLKYDKFHNISIDSVVGKELFLCQHDSLKITIRNCYAAEIRAFSYGKQMLTNDSIKRGYPSLDLTVMPSGKVSNFPFGKKSSLSIFDKDLRSINVSGINSIFIRNCSASTSSKIKVDNTLDSICIFKLRFKTLKGSLQLSATNKTFNKKIILMIRDSDLNLSQIDFNYTNFTYRPDNAANYLTVQKNFSTIIASQKRHFYQNGFINASIDSAKFEDSQHYFTSICIPIKEWWNNYGYDKQKVIGSIGELFFFFFFMNLLQFPALLEIYDFGQVKAAREECYNFSHKISVFFSKAMLCLIYTGILFFGVKLEFKNMNFNNLTYSNLRLIFFIFLQYCLGIVSLAYIANLIITK